MLRMALCSGHPHILLIIPHIGAFAPPRHHNRRWLPRELPQKPKPRPTRTEAGTMNPVKALESHGQAVWLDFLARGFIAKGDLKKLIDTDGVKGVTSNPSIFEKAIGSSDEYDGAIG